MVNQTIEQERLQRLAKIDADIAKIDGLIESIRSFNAVWAGQVQEQPTDEFERIRGILHQARADLQTTEG